MFSLELGSADLHFISSDSPVPSLFLFFLGSRLRTSVLHLGNFLRFSAFIISEKHSLTSIPSNHPKDMCNIESLDDLLALLYQVRFRVDSTALEIIPLTSLKENKVAVETLL